jgi:sulfur-carrier protein
MHIKLLFFGSIGALTGKNEMFLDGVSGTDELKNHLFKTWPDLKNYTFRFAVNQELIEENRALKEGDIVAIMPPFAGG